MRSIAIVVAALMLAVGGKAAPAFSALPPSMAVAGAPAELAA
jgi:hypothetical protein